jgi:hypothetical protein
VFDTRLTRADRNLESGAAAGSPYRRLVHTLIAEILAAWRRAGPAR